MSLPAPGPDASGWSGGVTPGVAAEPTSPPHRERRGVPGGRVVTAATLVVIAVAIAEVLVRNTIALWTDIALVTVSVVAALITRPGDRSLPAMMPPLAFLAAALVAGQVLVADASGSLRRREALMLAEVLGSNATWVVAATALSTTIALVRHLVDR